jgi:hypothetical protein
MSILDLQVTAIRSEGREAWTVVTVAFRWLNPYHGNGQWSDALAAITQAMESDEWSAYWSRPHFVESELYDGGPLWVVALEQPESAEAFSNWSLAQDGGWAACYRR